MVVVQTGENKFPLREAVQSQLESLEDLRLEDDVRALEEEVTVDDIAQHESENVPQKFSKMIQLHQTFQSMNPSHFPD